MEANRSYQQKHYPNIADMERSEMEGGKEERGVGKRAATSMPYC